MQNLHDSLKFRQWKAELEKNGNEIRKVEDLHTVRKGNGDVLFSLIKMEASSPEGNPLLPIALLRGHFVAVLMCLIDRESREEYYLLVRQRRVANGELFYEHPAGMSDSEADPWEVALIEVEEETGVKISHEDLHLLREDVLYSSPGLLDEGGYFFACELEMDKKEMEELDSNHSGHGGEGEFIHTCIVPAAEAAPLIRSANGVLHIFLYKEWKSRQGTN